MLYEGIIDRIIGSNPTWASIIFKTKNNEYLKASGNIIAPIVGYNIELKGEETVHPKFGPQILVKESKVTPAKTMNGIISYLASGVIRGIGPTMAKRIVDKFGQDTLMIMKTNPDKLLEVKGISKKKCSTIITSYQEQTKLSDLYELLQGQITFKQSKKIMEQYGDNAIDVIKENPYQLIYDIDGFGFIKVDNIAKASGIDQESIQRMKAGIIYFLKTDSEMKGNCFSYLEELRTGVLKLLYPIPKLADKAFNALIEDIEEWEEKEELYFRSFDRDISNEQYFEIKEWVTLYVERANRMADAIMSLNEEQKIIIDEERIYWKKLFETEVSVAQMVFDMLNQTPVKMIERTHIISCIEQYEKEKGFSLMPKQKEGIFTSLNNRLSIITGGPGRGKSTIIDVILKAWDNPNRVVVLAPTGKAAQRISEITGYVAETIHRFSARMKNNDEYLENYLVIADEMSMADINVACILLALAKNNNLILLGDVDQLPSIGAGNFFRDLISSGVVPTTRLIEGHRNSGSIAFNSECINKGLSMKNFKLDKHFKFEEIDYKDSVSYILKEYQSFAQMFPLKEIGVLVPQRTRGYACCNALNKEIRDLVNPYDYKSPKIEGVDFRVNDRIMHIKNNYQLEWTSSTGEKGLGVFNGDCGFIKTINPEENTMLVEFDDGKRAEYQRLDFDELTLAYAMTIHKSQGSEYKAVIMALSKENYIMLARNLFYTGESRARKYFSLFGDSWSINYAIQNIQNIIRYTYLKERILLLFKEKNKIA